MTKIARLVVLGDSLSDRGTIERRKLLGFIPMSLLSGLSSKSLNGRFTNGFLWGDYISTTIAEGFTIEHERRKLKLKDDDVANADISDEFLTNSQLHKKSENAFSLNDDQHVLFKGERFARYYCEGGLTAYDWKETISLNPELEGSRLILATLAQKRKALLTDDKKYQVSKAEKAETLVIEWSGANDLATVNSKPSHDAADKAVAERINNIELLIQKGYRNFVLFNLPNLSLTPRFQDRSEQERDNAGDCAQYFNKQLAAQCEALRNKYKELHIPINLSVFEVDKQFQTIYQDPEKYGFDKEKLTTPFTKSADFDKSKADKVNQGKHVDPLKRIYVLG